MIRKPRPTYICKYCTNPFTTTYSITERPTGPPKFCNQVCYRSWKEATKKPSKRKPATCHPERPHAAKGLCNSCYAKKHSAENKESYRKAARTYVYKKSYGISLETYQEMVNLQSGKCLICDKVAPRLNVDHDHKTGKVRGLLCPAHNKGLGHFNDSPNLLEKAAAYLRTHGRN